MRRIPHTEASSNGNGASHVCDWDALAARKDELEMALGAAGLGICRMDPEIGISRADSQFKALFGLAPDGAPTWPDLAKGLADSDLQTLRAALSAAFDQGEALDVVVRTSWSGDGPHWVSLRGRALFDASGGHSSLLLIARDATDEQRAVMGERRLRHSAEAANRAKDEFLSVISHEMRSPLNAILGWNRILAIKRAEDAEVQSVAPRIEQSAKAQLKMVNDLLDLGRIGTGKLQITPRQMRLSSSAAIAIDAIRPAAAAKRIEIVADIHSMARPVFGDPDRLSQVVSNLLSNAVKFTSADGRITVRLQEQAGRAELSVMDTGQGISADLLPHIFDRFRQGDSSTTRSAGGLGLGLALVREIVALHGGTVSARSEGIDRGSTFTITLPAAAPGCAPILESRGKPGNSLAEQLSGLSILVVDDEADARAVVAETLRLEGAQVTIGDCVRTALEYLRAPDARFDVVVTDIGMPEEDGYSLVRKLRSLRLGERIVAIALTGYASRGDIESAIDAGFDLHVPKPVDFDKFVPIIRRLAAAR